MGNAQSDNESSASEGAGDGQEMEMDPSLTDPDALYALFAQGLSPEEVLSSEAFTRMQNRIAGTSAEAQGGEDPEGSVL